MTSTQTTRPRFLFARRAGAAIAICLLALAGGCGGTGQPHVTERRLDKGLVLVLTGIHGRLWLSESIGEGLDRGGVDCAIEICDWTYQGKLLPFYNLGACERNHDVARQIARRIVEYQKAHPGRPVTLVGYSGGGPLAVWIAEVMPKGAMLEGVILLSAPLVPEYDLAPALAVSRKGVVNFYSNRDIIYLGVGTLVFGTMDKQHRVSAGNLGFTPPQEEVARESYSRLFQISWRSDMDKLGYSGSHLTIGAADFIAACVAPLVRSRTWDQDMVDHAAKGDCPPPETASPAAPS